MLRRKTIVRLKGYTAKAIQSGVAAPSVTAVCFIVVMITAFALCAEQAAFLTAQGFTPTFADSLLWLLASHRGIPFLWCVVPAVFMIWLVMVGSTRKSVNWAIRHDDSRQLWLEDISDVIFGSVIFAATTMTSACAAAAMFSCGSIDFDSTHSLFEVMTGEALLMPPSIGGIIMTACGLAFFVLTAVGAIFQLGRIILGNSLVPFTILTLLGLPAVHGPQAFFIEIARLFGIGVNPSGSAMNPLSLPYEVSSVFYDSWLPQSSHGLWLQMLLFTVALIAGLLFAPRKDNLES